MSESNVRPEQMLVYPTDPEWWKKRLIKPGEVLAYFKLYQYGHEDGFCPSKLFLKDPKLREIFATQLAMKIINNFKEKKKDLPEWVVGSSFFAEKVAEALGLNFISPLRCCGIEFLNRVKKDSLLQVQDIIYSKIIIEAYNRDELNFCSVVACCLCSEEIHADCFEVVSLATI